MGDHETSRKSAIEIVKRKILQSSFPHLQISFIILLTALAGFLTSFILLQAEVNSMAFRYPFAIIVAYCAFLFLLRIWLWLQTDNKSDFSIDASDFELADIALPSPRASSGDLADADPEFSGGGDFAGGGAGGSWSGGGNVSRAAGVGFADTSQATDARSSGSSGSSFLDGLDFDDGIWLILVIIALAAAFIAAIYVIYIAPVLLAEIFVDGVLVTGLYRRVRKVDQQYWLKTAVKKTFLPVLIIAVCFSIAGFGLQEIAPEARSIGEVWSQS
ncbi:MAG: hypothetical protein HKN25_01985 [Pyrinomonadaceae bacterium]|nr:hypothetical protein [Pyrinomonadaceae bacterium]